VTRRQGPHLAHEGEQKVGNLRGSAQRPERSKDSADRPLAPARCTHRRPRSPHTCTTNHQAENTGDGIRQAPLTPAKLNSRYQSCAKLRPKAGVRATEESSKRHQMLRTKSSTHDSADAAKANPAAHKKHSYPTLTAPPKRPPAPTDANGPPRPEKAPRPRKEHQNKRKQTVVGCKPLIGDELRARKIPINPVEFR
jgi:hypothetical protein